MSHVGGHLRILMATKSTVLQCNNSINKRCLKKTLADQNTEIALEDILKC